MADVAPGVLTFGLGGSATNLIIGNIFNLGYITIGSPILPPVGSPTGSPLVPPVPPKGGGGGGIPMAPGQIGKLYQPVDGEPWPTLQDFPDGSRFPVTIKLEFKGHKIERNYIVTKKRANMIVKVLNFMKRIQDTVEITISNFKKRAAKVMGVFNIRKK